MAPTGFTLREHSWHAIAIAVAPPLQAHIQPPLHKVVISQRRLYKFHRDLQQRVVAAKDVGGGQIKGS